MKKLTLLFFVSVITVVLASTVIAMAKKSTESIAESTEIVKQSTFSVISLSETNIEQNKQEKNKEKDKEVVQLIEVVRKKMKERKLNEYIPYFLRISPPYPEDIDDVLKLGKTMDSSCIPVLEEIITSYPSVVTRKNALKSLSLIAEKYNSAIKAISKALNDPNITVRGETAGLLVKFGEKEKALPVLIEIATIKDMDKLEKHILEDEYWRSEFIILDLWLKGKKEEAIKQNPYILTVSKKYIQEWTKRYNRLKEDYILRSLESLSKINNKKALQTIKKVSKKGLTERIRNKAKDLLAEIQKREDK